MPALTAQKLSERGVFSGPFVPADLQISEFITKAEKTRNRSKLRQFSCCDCHGVIAQVLFQSTAHFKILTIYQNLTFITILEYV